MRFVIQNEIRQWACISSSSSSSSKLIETFVEYSVHWYVNMDAWWPYRGYLELFLVASTMR